MKLTTLPLLIFVLSSCHSSAQKMDFETYNPRSTLVTESHIVRRAKFPFIDVHSHQWSMPGQDLPALLSDMDSLNMKVMVNLSGRGFDIFHNNYGGESMDMGGIEHLNRSLDNVAAHAKGRILVFTNIDFSGIDNPDWTRITVEQLEKDVQHGAAGLKVYKELGLDVRDKKGRRIHVDDPRLDPIWEKCGELGIPVLIHTGEPIAFFDKMDENNERWLELKLHPDRARSASEFPGWKTVMAEQHHIFSAHKHTHFVAAHFGWLANNLKALGEMLDTMPNVYVEFAAVLEEIGRQPRAGRAFFLKYQDRILFGKDTWSVKEYAFYFRMMETDDEYFPPLRKYHAFWSMYVLGLPDDVLKKIYYKNALTLFPQIQKTMFPR